MAQWGQGLNAALLTGHQSMQRLPNGGTITVRAPWFMDGTATAQPSGLPHSGQAGADGYGDLAEQYCLDSNLGLTQPNTAEEQDETSGAGILADPTVRSRSTKLLVATRDCTPEVESGGSLPRSDRVCGNLGMFRNPIDRLTLGPSPILRLSVDRVSSWFSVPGHFGGYGISTAMCSFQPVRRSTGV